MSLTTEDKKFITGAIGELAVVVKKGFDEVDRRFDEVQTDVKEIKGSLTDHNKDIERLNNVTRGHSADLAELKTLHPNMRHR